MNQVHLTPAQVKALTSLPEFSEGNMTLTQIYAPTQHLRVTVVNESLITAAYVITPTGGVTEDS